MPEKNYEVGEIIISRPFAHFVKVVEVLGSRVIRVMAQDTCLETIKKNQWPECETEVEMDT